MCLAADDDGGFKSRYRISSAAPITNTTRVVYINAHRASRMLHVACAVLVPASVSVRVFIIPMMYNNSIYTVYIQAPGLQLHTVQYAYTAVDSMHIHIHARTYTYVYV
jgi:hypothetical protein